MCETRVVVPEDKVDYSVTTRVLFPTAANRGVSQDYQCELDVPRSGPGHRFRPRAHFGPPIRLVGGENGCGKSTLLKATAASEYPVTTTTLYLLDEGAPPSDLGALEWVVTEAEHEMERLDMNR